MTDTALLIMDVQKGIVERVGDAGPPLVDRLARAAQAARAAGVPVLYVRVAFRVGAPEVDRTNPVFAGIAERPGMGLSDEATALHPRLAPEDDDIVIVKKRVSAFAGSDLAVVLRGLGVRSLVLAGISTSGVVLSTVRQAADEDYRLTVLGDGCADADDEVHRVLLEKVLVRQSNVVNIDEWVTSLPRP